MGWAAVVFVEDVGIWGREDAGESFKNWPFFIIEPPRGVRQILILLISVAAHDI